MHTNTLNTLMCIHTHILVSFCSPLFHIVCSIFDCVDVCCRLQHASTTLYRVPSTGVIFLYANVL